MESSSVLSALLDSRAVVRRLVLKSARVSFFLAMFPRAADIRDSSNIPQSPRTDEYQVHISATNTWTA
jgi:hypothetical protein